MWELSLLLFMGVLAVRAVHTSDQEPSIIPRKISDRLGKLWDIAHQGMRENRLLRAEKALLTILKIDQKNGAAYNRLGILYAKQKEYQDAINCFEIASSIEPGASSFHNLGLIYFETENYPKAAIAFEQAIRIEANLAARHIAYAKVQEKLGNEKLMIDELEKATELEPTEESYSLLVRAYRGVGREADADELEQKIEKLILANPRPRRVQRSKRVVI